MPFYRYHCKSCDKQFVTSHGMKETLSYCMECDAKDCVEKMLSDPCGVFKKDDKQPGKIVTNYIQDIKEDLKEQKKELEEERKK
jgi:predicted nucleic acid-binding Zn ribbon protein